ncbi:bifunctional glutamate N-acetyltransferase/amino-acid acetyltransferase ArgJ [Gemmobacter fulvus]|uniref:Arginine biosynthesis bifunctional protein ArgJ n=1 Tax=Gemmobacter fulvus TaxID=2840474 RepID=A0A975P4N3_9RHOB|nr:bifunctional glutamate N-acetyltransferase/amino-acid acetyltransferase ArgJ [Gemmobacter fulvus]MBT9247163.1 bifunctional glutamate N-acetyltransferase/amino-acid acetyltransferase ArgJ [Gemmobacter fulvus]QWK88963.1 bifunctional glutamate N-acetyltransferase/amino-acid acetyltransferase ArgJ [Gemmobacter fulvus]
MAKTDWKAEAKALKKKLKKKVSDLSAQLAEAGAAVGAEVADAAETAVAAVKKAAKPVSPLAPKDGFPKLPVIKGASFAAIGAGIKYQNRKDVMLVHLAPGTTVAGVFTRSSTRSGCVRDCQDKLAMKVPAGAGAAIVVNSGNSNAFTGKVGDAAVAAVTGGVAEALALPASRVFSSSTGVIGEPLPFEKITAVIPQLTADLTEEAIQMAAEAIMTTDTFPKGAAAVIEGEGGPIHISGIAKGSGMIAPDMATMLVYLFTDAKISAANLQKMLARNVDSTFNSITVDSDTSTSDTLLLCATGQSAAAEVKGPVAKAFEAALREVMMSLAHQVIRDGEGATKFVEIRVTGAASPEDAGRVAMSIANSPLVKTAVAGQDPNWGRIVAAIGKSGAAADRDRLKITFGDILVAEKGWRNPAYREEDGAAYMLRDELVIGVDLGLGRAARTVWTCDLTDRYIAINADYRS